jgi:ribosomal protein S1
METKPLQKEENEKFNWEIPQNFTINKKIKSQSRSKIYSHEEYAENLYELYTGYSQENFKSSKDLVDGEIYKCRISSINENFALAYTPTGQTIFIDLKKERKDAQKLNIQGLDFTINSQIEAITRKINETYYGSIVECYAKGLKNEFFEQIKLASVAYPAKIESINKGGYFVDISGVKCFLPGSLAAANKITDFESYIGKTVHVMIDGYVPLKDIFVVSHKKYLSNIMGQRIQELSLIKKYTGTVTGNSHFGLFIEWDEIFTGLIHKSEFEGEKINGFSQGDKVEFYVKEIKEDNKITLSFNPPSEKTIKIYKLKEDLDNGELNPLGATVKRKKSGCLVEIPEFDVLAMIPPDKMSQEIRDLDQGDRISVLIYEIEPNTGRIFAKPHNV